MHLPCVIQSSFALVCLLSVEGRADDSFFKPAVEARHPLFERDLGPIHNGGPYLGISFELETSDQINPRFIAGYEMASPSYLLYSVQAESNLDGMFAIAPGIEASSPLIAIAPHGPPMMGLGAGVRVPLEWGTRSDQGVRLYLSMMLGGVVIVDHNLDLMRGSGAHYRLGVRVSL